MSTTGHWINLCLTVAAAIFAVAFAVPRVMDLATNPATPWDLDHKIAVVIVVLLEAAVICVIAVLFHKD